MCTIFSNSPILSIGNIGLPAFVVSTVELLVSTFLKCVDVVNFPFFFVIKRSRNSISVLLKFCVNSIPQVLLLRYCVDYSASSLVPSHIIRRSSTYRM